MNCKKKQKMYFNSQFIAISLRLPGTIVKFNHKTPSEARLTKIRTHAHLYSVYRVCVAINHSIHSPSYSPDPNKAADATTRKSVRFGLLLTNVKFMIIRPIIVIIYLSHFIVIPGTASHLSRRDCLTHAHHPGKVSFPDIQSHVYAKPYRTRIKSSTHAQN